MSASIPIPKSQPKLPLLNMDTTELVAASPVPSTFEQGIKPTAYSQWAIIILKNLGKTPMKLQGLELQWGKLHRDGEFLLSCEVINHSNLLLSRRQE